MNPDEARRISLWGRPGPVLITPDRPVPINIVDTDDDERITPLRQQQRAMLQQLTPMRTPAPRAPRAPLEEQYDYDSDTDSPATTSSIGNVDTREIEQDSSYVATPVGNTPDLVRALGLDTPDLLIRDGDTPDLARVLDLDTPTPMAQQRRLQTPPSQISLQVTPNTRVYTIGAPGFASMRVTPLRANVGLRTRSPFRSTQTFRQLRGPLYDARTPRASMEPMQLSFNPVEMTAQLDEYDASRSATSASSTQQDELSPDDLPRIQQELALSGALRFERGDLYTRHFPSTLAIMTRVCVNMSGRGSMDPPNLQSEEDLFPLLTTWGLRTTDEKMQRVPLFEDSDLYIALQYTKLHDSRYEAIGILPEAVRQLTSNARRAVNQYALLKTLPRVFVPGTVLTNMMLWSWCRDLHALCPREYGVTVDGFALDEFIRYSGAIDSIMRTTLLDLWHKQQLPSGVRPLPTWPQDMMAANAEATLRTAVQSLDDAEQPVYEDVMTAFKDVMLRQFLQNLVANQLWMPYMVGRWARFRNQTESISQTRANLQRFNTGGAMSRRNMELFVAELCTAMRALVFPLHYYDAVTMPMRRDAKTGRFPDMYEANFRVMLREEFISETTAKVFAEYVNAHNWPARETSETNMTALAARLLGKPLVYAVRLPTRRRNGTFIFGSEPLFRYKWIIDATGVRTPFAKDWFPNVVMEMNARGWITPDQQRRLLTFKVKASLCMALYETGEIGSIDVVTLSTRA